MSFFSEISTVRPPPLYSISRRNNGRWRRATKPMRSCRKGRRRPKVESKPTLLRLETLKELIPSACKRSGGEEELLFEETAEYIIRLRTQVEVLKKLVYFYGAGEGNAAVAM